MEWTEVAKVNEVKEGEMKSIQVENDVILLTSINSKYYAMDAVCSHMGCFLPKGKLENNVVTCPCHHAQFDVKTGKVVKNVSPIMRIMKSAKDLKTYETKVQGNKIFVKNK